jgi:hypothetical protein
MTLSTPLDFGISESRLVRVVCNFLICMSAWFTLYPEKGRKRGIPSQSYNWMHSTEMCLLPCRIREVLGAALIDARGTMGSLPCRIREVLGAAFIDARGTVGLLPCSGAEQQIVCHLVTTILQCYSSFFICECTMASAKWYNMNLYGTGGSQLILKLHGCWFKSRSGCFASIAIFLSVVESTWSFTSFSHINHWIVNWLYHASLSH